MKWNKSLDARTKELFELFAGARTEYEQFLAREQSFVSELVARAEAWKNIGVAVVFLDVDETMGCYWNGDGKRCFLFRPSMFSLLEHLQTLEFRLGLLSTRSREALLAQLASDFETVAEMIPAAMREKLRGVKNELCAIEPFIDKGLVFSTYDFQPTPGTEEFVPWAEKLRPLERDYKAKQENVRFRHANSTPQRKMCLDAIRESLGLKVALVDDAPVALLDEFALDVNPFIL